MKSETAIYIFTPHPVFNPITVKSFESFAETDSVILFSTLLENLIEVVKGIKITSDNFLILNTEDEYLFKQDTSGSFKVKFLSDDFRIELPNYLANKSVNYRNNLFILSDSIGISPETISHCFNLLNIEDDSLVIGKTYSGFISFLAYNNIDGRTINLLIESDFNYMKFLSQLDTHPAFINIIERVQRLLTKDDFKKLYTELSKKESMNYCSQEMHQQFTHLFIEHKEMLH